MQRALASLGLLALGWISGCGAAAAGPSAQGPSAQRPPRTPPATGSPGADGTVARTPELEGAPREATPTPRRRSLPERFRLLAQTSLRELAPEGQWLLGCAPNDDGRRSLTLWTGEDGGEGLRARVIDRLLGTSSTGRFVAFERGGRAFLFDSVDESERSIPHASEGPPLLVAFSSRETTLLVLESGGARAYLVPLDDGVPELAPKKSVELERTVYSVRATRSGFSLRWTDRPEPRLAKDYCDRPGFPAFPHGKLRALREHRDSWLLDESGERLRPAPGFLGETAAFEVFRSETGALRALSGDQSQELASAECGGRILGVSGAGDALALVCEEHRLLSPPSTKPEGRSSTKKPTKPKLRFPIVLTDGSSTTALGAETMRTGADILAPGGRFVGIRLGAQPTLLDFGERRAVALPAGHVALSTNAGFALLRQGKKIIRYPEAWSDERPREVAPLRTLLTAGPYFATPELLGSLDGSLAVFGAPETPLLLSERGWLLTRSTSAETDYVLRSLSKTPVPEPDTAPSAADPPSPSAAMPSPPPPLAPRKTSPVELTPKD